MKPIALRWNQIFGIFALSRQEEEGNPDHGDEGPDDGAWRDLLLEEEGRRGDDEDGNDGHDGGSDTRLGHLNSRVSVTRIVGL